MVKCFPNLLMNLQSCVFLAERHNIWLQLTSCWVHVLHILACILNKYLERIVNLLSLWLSSLFLDIRISLCHIENRLK